MAILVDYPGMGEIVDIQGNIPVLTDQKALENAINLWVCSFRGERLYRPLEGGIIIGHLYKPMSDERAKNIKNDLINGLTYSFDPTVTVRSCVVIPDYERNTYWIEINGYCPALKISIYSKTGLKVQI